MLLLLLRVDVKSFSSIILLYSEKYLQNLMQIEVLLRMWFPQKAFKPTDTPKQTTIPIRTPHWRQNQLHMPVKVSLLPYYQTKDFIERFNNTKYMFWIV